MLTVHVVAYKGETGTGGVAAVAQGVVRTGLELHDLGRARSIRTATAVSVVAKEGACVQRGQGGRLVVEGLDLNRLVRIGEAHGAALECERSEVHGQTGAVRRGQRGWLAEALCTQTERVDERGTAEGRDGHCGDGGCRRVV